ncbi:hypothetical protein DPEC_G00047010 [Dallia pectoralis]|uniref:Uncharacterized protein n=1 Tax=Dallia pectoralis TaxID=75939 RepID=A0ACC2HA24_DALPE|nr:hypothetical protein DPEC_G00047010 [Dallia pectoralis]
MERLSVASYRPNHPPAPTSPSGGETGGFLDDFLGLEALPKSSPLKRTMIHSLFVVNFLCLTSVAKSPPPPQHTAAPADETRPEVERAGRGARFCGAAEPADTFTCDNPLWADKVREVSQGEGGAADSGPRASPRTRCQSCLSEG